MEPALQGPQERPPPEIPGIALGQKKVALSTRPPTYRRLNHTADIGIEVWGGSLALLFENTAAALFGMITDSQTVAPTREETVVLSADAADDLLHDWLAELLYLFEVHGFLPCSFRVDPISATSLTARVRGETFDPDRHPIDSAVKAVTRHRLSVQEGQDGRWKATVIFDV